MIGLSIIVHVVAFIIGLMVLWKYRVEFTNRPCILSNGIDDVELCYMSVVLSTLLAPLTLYHLVFEVNPNDFSGNNGYYWLGLGLLLSLFHVITKRLMEKVRLHGLNSFTV